MNFGTQPTTTNYQMTEQEINHLAYQFNKQNYINMIVNQYKTDPKEARIACRWWMDSYPQILSDLGVLVKAELEKEAK